MCDLQYIVTCEHGGNAVPERYVALFAGSEEILATHRAYDLHALDTARSLSGLLAAPFFFTTVTRLIVDCNRSPDHPDLFSAFTRPLKKNEKQSLLDTHYHPHRNAVANSIRHSLLPGRTVCHLAVHSFTPELNGRVRTMDLGLLYDPKREGERQLCHIVQTELKKMVPALVVRKNAPYRGTADGLTTQLRRVFQHRYLGIELEFNQRLYRRDSNATTPSVPQLLMNLAGIITTASLTCLPGYAAGNRPDSQ